VKQSGARREAELHAAKNESQTWLKRHREVWMAKVARAENPWAALLGV
jgi:hypothetical protein